MRRANHDLIDVAARLVGETEKAFRIDDGGRQGAVWVPKQYAEDNGDDTFTMPEWIALEKGLI